MPRGATGLSALASHRHPLRRHALGGEIIPDDRRALGSRRRIIACDRCGTGRTAGAVAASSCFSLAFADFFGLRGASWASGSLGCVFGLCRVLVFSGILGLVFVLVFVLVLLVVGRTRHEHARHPAAFNARRAGRHIHDQPFAAQHILTLRDQHVAGQRDAVGLHVEQALVAGGGLFLLRDVHAAERFELLDRRRAAGSGLCCFHAG